MIVKPAFLSLSAALTLAVSGLAWSAPVIQEMPSAAKGALMQLAEKEKKDQEHGQGKGHDEHGQGQGQGAHGQGPKKDHDKDDDKGKEDAGHGQPGHEHEQGQHGKGSKD